MRCPLCNSEFEVLEVTEEGVPVVKCKCGPDNFYGCDITTLKYLAYLYRYDPLVCNVVDSAEERLRIRNIQYMLADILRDKEEL